MSFGKKITPANRIREQIDLPEMISRLGMSVPIQIKNEVNHDMAIFSSVYVFSGDRLDSLVREIVQFTYDETFNMLKRRMNYDESNT